MVMCFQRVDHSGQQLDRVARRFNLDHGRVPRSVIALQAADHVCGGELGQATPEYDDLRRGGQCAT
jgi:hypothetical protein